MPSASIQPTSRHVPVPSVMCVTLPQAAVSALWHGQVVEAIKLVRAEQKIGLKESRELIDAYVRTQPALLSRIGQAQADAREGLFRWLIFLLVGGAGLAYLLV